MNGIVGLSGCAERERLVQAPLKDLPRISPASSPPEQAARLSRLERIPSVTGATSAWLVNAMNLGGTTELFGFVLFLRIGQGRFFISQTGGFHMNGAQALILSLLQEGVDHIFGYLCFFVENIGRSRPTVECITGS